MSYEQKAPKTLRELKLEELAIFEKRGRVNSVSAQRLRDELAGSDADLTEMPDWKKLNLEVLEIWREEGLQDGRLVRQIEDEFLEEEGRPFERTFFVAVRPKTSA